MYTIISAIEETIFNKKANLRCRREEVDRLERENAKEEKDVACLVDELNRLKQNVGPLNGMKTPPPPDCCVGLASNSDPIAMRKY